MYNKCSSSARNQTIALMKRFIAAAVLITIAGLGFRLFIALRLPTDEPDDGRLYARIATNVLDHRTYSIETEEPYPPTLIRVPGYPLFIAGVYLFFGRANNRAVRVAQAVLDTITCWLIALLALAWAPVGWERNKRRRLLLIALAMAVCCPFPAIYVATILTETCTTLLATACALFASLALKSESRKKSAASWVLAGIAGGLATLFRPDSGLFVAAVGFSLALVGLYRIVRWRRSKAPPPDVTGSTPGQILARTIVSGMMLTVGFALALAPWSIRNERVFGVFQPIAPAQANMPGEFVPNGYIRWLRTWVDDVKYTESLEWPLDQDQIHIEKVPDFAFDSAEERERVAGLLQQYNNPPSASPQQTVPAPDTKTQASAILPTQPAVDQPSTTKTGSQTQPSVASPPATDEQASDEVDSPDDRPDEPDEAEGPKPTVEMTPEVDAGFAELAAERIGRHPVRYYLIVPLKRAASLWFDTHSQYYPFQGQLLPLSELDTDLHQQYWLPLFMFLTLLYTALGFGGAWLVWRNKPSRAWLLMLALLIVPRLALLASMENPEPRYAVEFFAFVTAVGSVAMVNIWDGVYARMKRLRR
jgi:Dolichyl-phosphate-mannose-protein mannosyltransferase